MPLIRHSICHRCGMPMGAGIDSCTICPGCRKEKFAFAQARCGGEYTDSLRDMLLSFKFHGVTPLRFPLSALIFWQIRRVPFPQNPDILVPVPMNYSSQVQRGYNQAALLCENLSQRMKIPCFSHLLLKNKKTKPQADLQRSEREKNLVSCFEVKKNYYVKKLQGKIVLLVDDILTTGNTASECSKVLLQNGAKKVYVATVAKTLTLP